MNLTTLQQLTKRNLNIKEKEDNIILATTYENTKLLEKTGEKQYEWFQIFDQNDQPIKLYSKDVICYRKECHGHRRIKGVYHRGVGAFMVNKRNEMLVSIRSSDKDLYPSMGDLAVGEHLKVRESYLDGVLRGFREEQRISVEEDRLEFLMKRPVVATDQSEMVHYYLFRHNGEELKFSEETASQRWVPINELGDIAFRDDLIPAIEIFLTQKRDQL